MSIQLDAQVIKAVTLADILMDAEAYLASVPHKPFLVGPAGPTVSGLVSPAVPPSGVLVGTGGWCEDVAVFTGRIAKIYLSITYRPGLEEMDIGRFVPNDADWSESNALRGHWARIDAAAYRTKASFCLGALIVCAIACRNSSRILDESKLLRQGRWAHPEPLAEIFAKYRGAQSFEEFADAFCEEIDFARNWQSARSVLAELEESSN